MVPYTNNPGHKDRGTGLTERAESNKLLNVINQINMFVCNSYLDFFMHVTMELKSFLQT